MQIKYQDKIIIVGAIYIPPESSPEYQLLVVRIESLQVTNKKAKFIVMEDFNLPNVNWRCEDGVCLPEGLTNVSAEILLGGILRMELSQCHTCQKHFWKATGLGVLRFYYTG